MTNVFVPKLYVFTKEYNPKLADFFGEENLKVIDLTKLDRLDNTNSNAVFQVANFFFANCYMLTIIENYRADILTFLSICGTGNKVFRADTPDDENDFITLSQMVENVGELSRNYEHFAYSMEVLVEDAAAVLEQTEYDELNETFMNAQSNFSYFEDMLHDSLKYKVKSLQLATA